MSSLGLLDRVPDELVEQMVKFSDPLFENPFAGAGYKQFYPTRRDLVNLCLTSQRLRRFALVRLYSQVEIDDNIRMRQFLRSIIRNSSLGMLVRKLHLEWHGEIDMEEDDDVDDEDGNSNEDDMGRSELDAFGQAALEFNLDNEVLLRVRTGSESAMVLLILCSLSNLLILELQPPYAQGLFKDFRKHITDRFLTKLKQVEYSHYDTEDGCSLTGDEDEDLNLQGFVGKSSVETFNLYNSDVDLHNFSQLIQLPRCLKNIYYEKCIEVLGAASATRREFSNAVSLVSDTLESLNVEWNVYDVAEDASILGPLIHFTNLKRLSVGFADLLGESPGSSAQLAEFLPPNLEELQLTKAGPDNLGWHQWHARDYIESTRQLLLAKKHNATILSRLKNLNIPKVDTILDGDDEENAGVLEASARLIDLATYVRVEIGPFVWNFGVIDM